MGVSDAVIPLGGLDLGVGLKSEDPLDAPESTSGLGLLDVDVILDDPGDVSGDDDRAEAVIWGCVSTVHCATEGKIRDLPNRDE